MLSDSLSDVRQKLLKEISYYSKDPFGTDYPNSQELNITLALYYLQLAQMAFDSFKYPDNHTWDKKDELKAMKRAKKEFKDAVNKIDSDSE